MLRAIRDGPGTLRLCLIDSSGGLYAWATLSFETCEELVLSYSIFVALKHQDPKSRQSTPSIDQELLEEPGDLTGDYDEELFGGVLRAGSMLHALRLFRSTATSAVRLEAKPLRDDYLNAPIWTAFLTKYVLARDRDFFMLEGENSVSMCAQASAIRFPIRFRASTGSQWKLLFGLRYK